MSTHPGVFVDEIPADARTITGVPTSITAFVGSALRGPLDVATRVESFAAFNQQFGGLSPSSPMSYSVDQFFRNGGSEALIVRVAANTGNSAISDGEISDPSLEASRRGIWALDDVSVFNLLCIPPFAFGAGGDLGGQTRSAAATYCKKRRAFFIADALYDWQKPSDVISGPNGIDSATWGMERDENVAVYFPRIVEPDPLQNGQLTEFAPSGAIAGVYARTDTTRGVWKAPAGTDASLLGVSKLSVNLTDADSGPLNTLGVNCLRPFPAVGIVVWGARTLRGADTLASEWKYVSVRRLALFIEESISRGIQWAVFEPNDESLWSQIRLHIGNFMHVLFRAGAFQGSTPQQAYFVKCDGETTTNADIDAGIVNILVGFAPLKPAEFVVIQITQMAGQAAV